MDRRRAQAEAQELVDGLAEEIGELAAATGEDMRLQRWITDLEWLQQLVESWPPDETALAALERRYTEQAAQAGEGSLAARMRDVVRQILR